jgi:hypothetical protein
LDLRLQLGTGTLLMSFGYFCIQLFIDEVVCKLLCFINFNFLKMIFSPLEQFEVLVLPFNFEPLLITGLTIRGFIVCVLLNLFVSLLFSRSAPANIFLVPNRWQLLIELFTSIV